MPTSHAFARAGTAAVASAIIVLGLAAPASAHVTVAADDATQGASDAIITFRVPNEQDDATTVKIDIRFPTEHPIASLKPLAIPGWTITTKPVTFNPPITTDDGTITDGIGEIVYTAAPGSKGIPIGDAGAFPVLAAPLPDVPQVVFSAVQTYSNGKVTRWIEPLTDPSNAPENPTPVLNLQPAAAAHGGSSSSSSTASQSAAPTDLSQYAKKSDVGSARLLGLIAVTLGAVAVMIAAVGLPRRRATTAPPPSQEREPISS